MIEFKTSLLLISNLTQREALARQNPAKRESDRVCLDFFFRSFFSRAVKVDMSMYEKLQISRSCRGHVAKFPRKMREYALRDAAEIKL